MHACVAQDHNSSGSFCCAGLPKTSFGERRFVVISVSAHIMLDDSQRQSPSRSWFAAHAVNDRVASLEQQMVTLRTREMNDLRTMFDSLVSRQNSITNNVDRLRARTADHHNALADIVENHGNIIDEHSRAFLKLIGDVAGDGAGSLEQGASGLRGHPAGSSQHIHEG